jgi:hypothetical protein
MKFSFLKVLATYRVSLQLRSTAAGALVLAFELVDEDWAHVFLVLGQIQKTTTILVLEQPVVNKKRKIDEKHGRFYGRR